MNSHFQIQNFKCEYEGCNRLFSQKNRLKLHSLTHTSAETRVISCRFPKCKKTFQAKEEYINHKEVHGKLKYYKCYHTDCKAKYSLSASLKKHLIQHDSTKTDFYCTFCPLYYTRYDTLMVHIKSHLEKEEKAKMLGKKRVFKIEKTSKSTAESSAESNFSIVKLPQSIIDNENSLNDAKVFLKQLSMNLSENGQTNFFDFNLNIAEILYVCQLFDNVNHLQPQTS